MTRLAQLIAREEGFGLSHVTPRSTITREISDTRPTLSTRAGLLTRTMSARSIMTRTDGRTSNANSASMRRWGLIFAKWFSLTWAYRKTPRPAQVACGARSQ